MSTKVTDFISEEELEIQNSYADKVRTVLDSRYGDKKPLAYIHTYGCQGNVSDSERIRGILENLGYGMCDNIEEAKLVLYNTCAIREHAEDRVFGNVGKLKAYKKDNPDAIIALCGCMMQQERVAQRIEKSYPYVNLVFGTHVIHKIPELIYKALCTRKRVFMIPDSDGAIAEGLPVSRDEHIRAWLPIMYGCDNFCSYCIVPYVRGRERSRRSEDILKEAKDIIAQGYKDITLLGQNVNSYGKNLDEDIDFSDLLKKINALDGEFTIRFMTSHPKDCTYKLIDTMAECEKVARHIHLPVQSGNNRVLKEMNRRYTKEQYMDLINYARKVMPDVSFTSDIIVGFPGETYDEFKDTLKLVDEVGFTSLFTFIFSPRYGTKAYSMEDPTSREEKGKWFKELLDLQEKKAGERTAKMKGKTYRVLVEEPGKQGENYLSGRTSGNVIIEFIGDKSLIGKFVDVLVTEPLTWIVKGELI